MDLDDEAQAGPVPLPHGVRQRVVALASDALGALPPEEVPATLRSFARFTPAKRARLAALPLATALETDAVFRTRVAEAVRLALPELTRALTVGEAVPAAAPRDVAAVAYVLRLPGWQEQVGRAAGELEREAQVAADAADSDAVRRLAGQLEEQRARALAREERLQSGFAEAQEEVVSLRRLLRKAGERTDRAEAAERLARTLLDQGRTDLARDRAAAEVERRALLERVEQAETAGRATRQAAREGRQADELRLRLLLDALVGAAAGLRRELALPPADTRPADALAREYGEPAPLAPPAQGRGDDDPRLLEALLAVPLTHLLVDGYNVTKAGYGELSLIAQRSRLLSGLGALGARTGAEVTVVFDGVDRATPLAAPAPRGVRLLFSRTGETADEVLRRLARHEPAGRPVVVVSSDREVADGVRRSGARPVPSLALLRLLERGRGIPVGRRP